MTVDHVGLIFYPELDVLRVVGRLSFPLFAYLLVLGMETTRNIRNYFIRLFVFAFISQAPFFLAIGSGPFDSLNIFFTLSAGLLFIHFFKKNSFFAAVPLIASLVLPFDYGVYGVAVIGCMYILTEDTKFGVVSLVLLNALFLVPWNIQFLAIAAIPLILLHKNGSLKTKIETNEDYRFPVWRKYFFYVYYPLHLSILYVIKMCLENGV